MRTPIGAAQTAFALPRYPPIMSCSGGRNLLALAGIQNALLDWADHNRVIYLLSANLRMVIITSSCVIRQVVMPGRMIGRASREGVKCSCKGLQPWRIHRNQLQEQLPPTPRPDQF